MRIVMLTDDASNIDRRILLEAESLIDLGHEVILLARQDGKTNSGGFYGRVKVEFLNTGVAAQPDLKVWHLPFIIVANFLKKHISFGDKIKNYIRQILHYRHDVTKYFATQYERITDSWIPLHRRIGVLFRSLLMLIFMLVFKVIYLIAGIFRIEKVVKVGGNFLDYPMIPHAWDEALIQRGKYYRPDLVIAHDLPQLFAGAAIKKALKIPLIYDTHEIYSIISSLTDKEKDFLRTREQTFIRKCDVVIAVNPFAAEWFEKEYKIKVHSITNATDLPEGFDLNKKYNRIREKLKLGKDVKILSYQGWFSLDGRGLQELIEAMKDVRKDVHLTMMGYGDFEYFQKLIDKHGVADRVHLMEGVPWQELLWWSASADVGIVPYQAVDYNHLICSPNKVFEFIAVRLPMLVNDLPYLNLVTEKTGFGIARKMTNPSEMSKAINEMFDEKLGHIAKAKANLNAKAEDWEWKSEAKRYLKYVDKTLHYLDNKLGAKEHLLKRAVLPEVKIPEIISNIKDELNKKTVATTKSDIIVKTDTGVKADVIVKSEAIIKPFELKQRNNHSVKTNKKKQSKKKRKGRAK